MSVYIYIYTLVVKLALWERKSCRNAPCIFRWPPVFSDAPICLDAALYFWMPPVCLDTPICWMPLYVLTVPYVCMSPVCLDYPICWATPMFGYPLYVWTPHTFGCPCMLGYPHMFGMFDAPCLDTSPVCLMPPYVWTPSTCLDALHMFGCPHMFRSLHVSMPTLDVPICLDAHLYVWSPPHVWATPYVWRPLYVWTFFTCLDDPYMFGHPICLYTPCIFGHPYFWIAPIHLTPPYVDAAIHFHAPIHLGQLNMGGILTCGHPNIWGAYGHSISLTKHAVFVL